jgi:endonuclease III
VAPARVTRGARGGPKRSELGSRSGSDAEASRMREVLRLLKRAYPGAECSLVHASPFQLLIATILSAQCTDERVNLVTPALFARFPDAAAMARARTPELEGLIQSTGFFRSKAKSIQEASRAILEKHGGQVPRDLDALTALRGVGRKTANVVLGNAFGVPGLVVDTHVGRLTRRLGFTREKDPVKVEHAMMELVPRADWTVFAHLMIAHGRAICTARKALCEECPVARLCPKVGVA